MKITFILPAIGKRSREPYISTWKMEPLTIAVLKALTPPDIECGFFDDRVELIDYNADTDLVAITVETYTAKRAYAIAGTFRRQGRKVILGGYHVTLMPDEALRHADAIVTGNAENVWARIVNDCKNGTLKRIYKGESGYLNIQPDRSVYREKSYLPLALVETGRGCPFNCTFCAISAYYCSRYMPRPVNDIMTEIDSVPAKNYFFIDDNIAGNPTHLANIVERVKERKIRWTSQGSLGMAKDPKLLKAMKESGCEIMLIGFESLDRDNLNQMNKGWRHSIGDTDELVKRIHDAGISIYATFVFGFDNDTRDTFEQVLDFSLRHRFFFAAFNHLLPFPGTPLYEQLRGSRKLTHEAWWLRPDYVYGDVPFRTKNMGPEELSERCEKTRREFYRYSSIARRLGGLLTRRLSPSMALLFLGQNIRLGQEIEDKMRLPLGTGLDELPK